MLAAPLAAGVGLALEVTIYLPPFVSLFSHPLSFSFSFSFSSSLPTILYNKRKKGAAYSSLHLQYSSSEAQSGLLSTAPVICTGAGVVLDDSVMILGVGVGTARTAVVAPRRAMVRDRRDRIVVVLVRLACFGEVVFLLSTVLS